MPSINARKRTKKATAKEKRSKEASKKSEAATPNRTKANNNTVSLGTLPKVLNLSQRPLCNTAKNLLIKKGLKFTPIQRQNIVSLQSDIYRFTRKLRLAEFKIDTQNIHGSLAKPPSTFTPSRGRDRVLDTYVDFLHKTPLEHIHSKRKRRFNLSNQELNILNQLKNDKSIIIKESDKGGSCVIMDPKFYNEKMMEELGKTDTYKLLDANI